MEPLDKTMTNVSKIAVKLSESVLKKAWTVLEAAVEKKMPSEYLSQQGVQAIQGKAPKG